MHLKTANCEPEQGRALPSAVSAVLQPSCAAAGVQAAMLGAAQFPKARLL